MKILPLNFLLIKWTNVVLAASTTVGSGGSTTTTGAAIAPSVVVNNFYQIALMASGLLAFGVIVFAALRYTLAAGNPSIQSDAKDQITQAILGLLLLLGAYLILNTINPNLTKLELPSITPLLPSSPPQGTSVACFFSQSGLPDRLRECVTLTSTSSEVVGRWCQSNCDPRLTNMKVGILRCQVVDKCP